MKQLSIFIIFCFTLWSCNTVTEKQTKPVTEPKEDTANNLDTQKQS